MISPLKRFKNYSRVSMLRLAGVRYVGLTENAGHEIAGHENTRHEFARHDKYRMKIDYITVQCAFPLNFISFVFKESVLTD